MNAPTIMLHNSMLVLRHCAFQLTKTDFLTGLISSFKAGF